MDFRILGSVEVSSGGLTLELSGPRQRALLAYLLLHANEVVSAERLLDELWTEPPRGGVAALQTQVSRLRRIVGERLQTVGSGYCMRVEPGELDFERFRSLLGEAGGTADPAERARLLANAEALWRSEPLAGLDVPFAAGERAALDELRLGAAEERLGAALECGSDAELVAELSSLVAKYPLRERLRANLILALYRSGRQAEALDAYHETRRMLDEELGLEPSPTLRELERAILRHDPALAHIAPMPTHWEEASSAQPSSRRRAVFAVAAVVALGSAAAAGALLTSGEGGMSQAQAKQPASTPALQPAHHAPAREAHKRSRPHATPPRVVKRKVSRPAAKPSATPPTPRATHTTPAKPALVTRKKKTTVKTTTTTSRVTSTPPPKPVTISDTFDSDIVDPTIWHQILSDANVSIAETGGQLVETIGPAALRTGTYNQIDAHVGTQCKFPGDFDARVDFTLLEWPQGDNIFVGLNAIYAGSAVGRQDRSQGGDMYSGWVSPDSNGTVPLPDMSGSLRITRVNGIETTYMWHRDAWVRLASAYAVGAAVFGLQSTSADSTSPFGGQEVKVAFDNFSVTGVNPFCPPGSQPGS